MLSEWEEHGSAFMHVLGSTHGVQSKWQHLVQC